ncbi:hypothetical protein PanWU01x14_336940 [Parasponia andersonii]|uniref:Uncharacterized protein n=1 Tax=Parasponia andersonii TaxID=3476 RepID=A0A2P5AFP2_PARAD|nr:hypothetical protein PanWU01x14_336940 [Parasponia andersonii]
MASSQLAGPNNLVAPTSHELEEAMKLELLPRRGIRVSLFRALGLHRLGHGCILIALLALAGSDTAPSERVDQDKTEKLQPDGSSSEVVARAAEAAANAPPPVAAKGALRDALSSITSTPHHFRSVKRSYWRGEKGEGPAAKFELEVLSLENLAVIQSFYSSYVGELTGLLNARAMVVEQREVTLAALRVDFDLYWSQEEARVSTAVAHALSTERARYKDWLPGWPRQRERSSLSKLRFRVCAQRPRAVDEAKEASKAETKAKLKAYSLQCRLDQSNEVIRYLYLGHYKLMEAHVEQTCKHSEDLADINTLLINLSQRLADAEKLKIRYQRQVNILSTESYRSGWENREFDGHVEVVTPDQFDEQMGVERDHYSVGYYMQ